MGKKVIKVTKETKKPKINAKIIRVNDKQIDFLKRKLPSLRLGDGDKILMYQILGKINT